MRRLIWISFAVVIVVSSAVGFYFLRWLHQPIIVDAQYDYFEVQKGDSLSAISRRLQKQGLIKYPKVWLAYAKFKSVSSVYAGEFALGETLTPVSILQSLQSGNVRQYQITFVEGKTISESLSQFSEHPKLKKTLPDNIDVSEVVIEGIESTHLEGWFFPDTYNYVAGDTDYSILLRAHERLKTVLEEEWQGRAEGLPYSSLTEALVMASIIEKETGVPHERAEIAGVFVRRLKKGMRLQTDPTVIYGMGASYKGNITRADLKRATPYNTYVIKGLPPTPIALVGREAIHAALHPAEGEALYFVAKGDGTHHFSQTLDEHLAAVKQYQLKRRSDYRSNY